jgi:hypothetical protein
VVLAGGLSVIGKHDGQHVAGQALQSFVPRDVKRTPPNGSDRTVGEASILVQDHASAIFQCDELAYREAHGTRLVRAVGAEIADGAKAYDAPWLDRGETTRAGMSVWVRAPAPIRTAHFTTPEIVILPNT